MRSERGRLSDNRYTWAMIGATALFSLALTLVSGWALRATAQQSTGAPASSAAPAGGVDEEAGPEGDALPDERASRAPTPPAPAEPPDLRESADNNLSFPVDI